jgi:hypothetical protein
MDVSGGAPVTARYLTWMEEGWMMGWGLARSTQVSCGGRREAGRSGARILARLLDPPTDGRCHRGTRDVGANPDNPDREMALPQPSRFCSWCSTP